MKSVKIDCFPESAEKYVEDHAIVCVDVIRATTSLITAAANGCRCFPVPSLQAAHLKAVTLGSALLVGEVGGEMPFGFDLNNSPAALSGCFRETLVLLSSTGTRLIANAAGAKATYLSCFRNVSATVNHLAATHEKVAIIGAGTRGEFREEDQMCCAWIAEGLTGEGFDYSDPDTAAIVKMWSGASVTACMGGHSAAYLRRSGQEQDLTFVLDHVDDLHYVFRVKDQEVLQIECSAPALRSTSLLVHAA